MFWCRDIGLAKTVARVLCWLLGSGLAASNHDTPKASCQCEWYKPTPTPPVTFRMEDIPLWILVAKVVDNGLLGRGQWVLRWFRIGCLLPRVKRAHPHVSMTLLSWDIPLISFNGSLWDVLLRCSKWLLGAWLDSFTMILRCWLFVWVKWARPLSLCTVIQSYVQLKSGFKSMGQLWDALAPQGASFTPLCGMFLQSPSASSNVANFTFLRNPLSELWVCEFWLLRCSTNGC